MVKKKKECYTKKKKDGSNYTTCVEGQKKPKRKRRTKAQMAEARGMAAQDKPAPKVKAKPKAKLMKGGKAVLMGLPINMKIIGQYAIPKKLQIYRKIFPKKNMVNVRQLLGVYGMMDTFRNRIPDGAEGANGRKLRDMVYNRKGMKRITREIGDNMDDQMRTLSNHKYIKEVMSFKGFMSWFYEVGYSMKNIDRNPDAKISIHTPFYDTPDFKKGEGLFESFSSRKFLLKMPELYARFGGVPNATPKLINGNIDLRMKTTKKGIQASYDDALKFLKKVHKHKRIR
tara:strand:- start:45 stop:899 length:855 start_codon:yes stop_codon:yes gene_type:complete